MGLFDKLKAGLKKTAEGIGRGLGAALPVGGKIPPEMLVALEEQLILVDVGVQTSRELLEGLNRRIPRDASSEPETFQRAVRQALREALLEKLQKTASAAPEGSPPMALFLVGVNGAGKTTTAGKLAAHWAESGLKVLLAAGDTFRAAAEEQLTEWAKRAKVHILRGGPQAAPSAVAFDALKSGVSQGYDRIIVDTAGRLHTRTNLMEELKKVLRAAEKAAPGVHREIWLVLDASCGQNGLAQAAEFRGAVGLTGVVLTKLDGTAKGGIAVALTDSYGLPIRYVGVGEGLDDLLPYDPKAFAEALVP